MHPILFNIHLMKFTVPIHSYGFMLAVSFLFGIWFAATRAKKEGLHPDVITDLGFWVILAAIVGARLYYVVLHFEEFQGDLLSIINPFHAGNLGIGGLVMYGGFIGALVAAIIYFRVKGDPFLPYADVSCASLGFGIFLTRIGCFLNGCCYGAATSSACGISFPLHSPAGAYQHEMHAHALLPSQLIESSGGLLIVVIILLVGTRKTFPGFRLYLTGIMYAVLRFAVDFTRFYTPQERLGPLSHNQIVCIVFFILFSGLILRHFLFKEEDTAQPGQPNASA
ncbi:MAG TPA: prolipoprotein diacylglyceryl transferase [Chitinivibrionales bacterium]|nr:prolipoprotein diacylglyceryl transferase [Chitinivibrionales bacterium]